MQLKYGGYAFQANSLIPRMTIAAVKNSHNQVYAYRQRVSISGSFIGTNTADITAQTLAMSSACIIPGQDLIYYDNNNAPTAYVLRNFGSLTGVQLVEPVDFNGTYGAIDVTMKQFAMSFEATYPAAGSAGLLLDFRETLTFSGGGPTRVCKRAVNTTPQLQMPYQYTEFYVVQSGSAVGFRDTPAIPFPIWPAFLMETGNTSQTSPHPEGLQYTNWPVTWSYRFCSPSPLIGIPNRWKL